MSEPRIKAWFPGKMKTSISANKNFFSRPQKVGRSPQLSCERKNGNYERVFKFSCLDGSKQFYFLFLNVLVFLVPGIHGTMVGPLLTKKMFLVRNITTVADESRKEWQISDWSGWLTRPTASLRFLSTIVQLCRLKQSSLPHANDIWNQISKGRS